MRGSATFSTASKYSIYSTLTLIFCYSFVAEYVSSRWATPNRGSFYATSLVAAAGMFLLVNVNAYKQLGARRRMVLSGIDSYRANPEVSSPMVNPLVDRLVPKEKAAALAILNRAIQEDIYALVPSRIFASDPKYLNLRQTCYGRGGGIRTCAKPPISAAPDYRAHDIASWARAL